MDSSIADAKILANGQMEKRELEGGNSVFSGAYKEDGQKLREKGL